MGLNYVHQMPYLLIFNNLKLYLIWFQSFFFLYTLLFKNILDPRLELQILYNRLLSSISLHNTSNHIQLIRKSHKIASLSTKIFKIFSKKKTFQFIRLFNVYLQVNIYPYLRWSKIHFSWNMYFLKNLHSSAIINTAKLHKWFVNMYNFIYSIGYYNLKFLFFGNSFFRSEILSLNWSILKYFLPIWRSSKFIFLSKAPHINKWYSMFLYKLYSLGFKLVFILDYQYHQKTSIFLRNQNFYTIGLVPTNYNMYVFDFPILTSSDTLITQVFFIRFFLKILKESKSELFYTYKQCWLGSIY